MHLYRPGLWTQFAQDDPKKSGLSGTIFTDKPTPTRSEVTLYVREQWGRRVPRKSNLRKMKIRHVTHGD